MAYKQRLNFNITASYEKNMCNLKDTNSIKDHM